MEDGVRAFLTSRRDVDLPMPLQQELLSQRGIESPLSSTGTRSARLKVHFLNVDNNSCYGRLSVFPANMSNPDQYDWLHSRELFTEIVNRRLCSSIMLRKGCESRGLFGLRYSPAIVGRPDFSKLSILKRLDMIDLSGLHEVFDALNSQGDVAIYCEGQWKALASECRNDPRFAPVFIK